MRRLARVWGVSIVAWAAVLAIAGGAIAAALASSEVTMTISPEGVVEGKTLDSDEPFEMTVHLHGEPSSSYDLAVTYGGDAVGTCQDDSATIETNPDGKGSWTCTFDTAANDGTSALSGTVTFTATREDSSVAVTANLSVRPAGKEDEEPAPADALEPEPPEQEPAGDEVVNHGHCVSYWAHESRARGLEGRARGAFISSIARDQDAVAPKTPSGGDPGADCDFSDELAEALAGQESAGATPPERGPRRGPPSEK